MLKFAIKLTKDNDSTILAVFDDKDTAMSAGSEYRKQYSWDMGLLSCILADFDENDKIGGSGYNLIHSWM